MSSSPIDIRCADIWPNVAASATLCERLHALIRHLDWEFTDNESMGQDYSRYTALTCEYILERVFSVYSHIMCMAKISKYYYVADQRGEACHDRDDDIDCCALSLEIFLVQIIMFVEETDHPIHSCLNALRSALPSEPKQYLSSVMTANDAKMESALAGFILDGENELLPNLSESFRSRYGLSSAENRVLETVLTRFAREADSALAAAKIFMETSFEDDECLAAAKAMLGSLIEILAMNELCAGYRLIQRKWGIPDEDDSGPIF